MVSDASSSWTRLEATGAAPQQYDAGQRSQLDDVATRAAQPAYELLNAATLSERLNAICELPHLPQVLANDHYGGPDTLAALSTLDRLDDVEYDAQVSSTLTAASNLIHSASAARPSLMQLYAADRDAERKRCLTEAFGFFTAGAGVALYQAFQGAPLHWVGGPLAIAAGILVCYSRFDRRVRQEYAQKVDNYMTVLDSLAPNPTQSHTFDALEEAVSTTRRTLAKFGRAGLPHIPKDSITPDIAAAIDKA